MGTLTDTGPLVALIDKAQQHHGVCVAALPGISMPLITTWPCLTEAMYLLGRIGGWLAQERLWKLAATRRVRLYMSADNELARVRSLMEQYRNVPVAWPMHHWLPRPRRSAHDASLLSTVTSASTAWAKKTPSRWFLDVERKRMTEAEEEAFEPSPPPRKGRCSVRHRDGVPDGECLPELYDI